MSKECRKRKAWEPLRVQDFNSLIHPYVFLNSIVGLFPYKIVSSKYVFSRNYFIWSTILMVIYICCTFYVVYKLNIEEKYPDSSYKWHISIIQLGGFMIIFASYAVHRSKMRGLRSMSSISRILCPRTIRVMSKWIIIKDVAQMTPIMCSLLYIYNRKSVISYICWITFFVILVSNKLLINSLLILKACFVKINESLVELREMLISDQPHVLRRVYHAQRNPVLLRELRNLKTQQLEVNKGLQLLSETFGFDNISTITMIMFDVTFNVYKCTMEILYGNLSQIWIWPFYCAAYYAMYIMSIVYVCESVKNQAKKSATTVHRILATTVDEELAAELELFSVQLHHQDATFATMGLKIDATLLTKIVGTIMTYLLVLIQFQLIKHC